jgi:hypothetical protein
MLAEFTYGKSKMHISIFRIYHCFKTRNNRHSREVGQNKTSEYTQCKVRQHNARQDKIWQGKARQVSKARDKDIRQRQGKKCGHNLLGGRRIHQIPTTNDQRPTASGQRPTTNDQRPKNKDQRIKTKNQRPKTKDQRPKTKGQRIKT